MEKISITKARDHLGDLANRVVYNRERIVLTKHNRQLALVPIEDLEALEAMEDREDILAAEAAKKEIEEQGAISWEDMKKELDL
jgi:prevent-host-death family protein